MEKTRRGLTGIDWLVAVALGAIAGAVWFIMLSDSAYPGESATLVSAMQGLEDYPTARYPIATWLCGLLGNAVAPLSGGVAVALLFLVTTRFLRQQLAETSFGQRGVDWSSRAAGIACAFVFFFTPSVRFAATHFEPTLVDLAWALAATGVLMAMRGVHGRLAALLPAVAGAMLGCGAADSPTFLLLLPLFIVGVWTIAARYDYRRGKFAAAACLSFFIVAMAWVVWSSYGELGGWYAGLKSIVRLWFAPRWSLLVPVFATLPFVVTLVSSRRAFRMTTSLVEISVYVLLSLAVVAAVASPFSAWAVMESAGYAPVFAASFVAFTAGFLLLYWWHMAKAAGMPEDAAEKGEKHRAASLYSESSTSAYNESDARLVGYIAGGVLVAALAISALIGIVASSKVVDADFADRVAERIIADMGEREWLVADTRVTGTKGPHIGTHIRLAAKKAGKTVRFIRLDRDRDPNYAEELAKTLEETGFDKALVERVKTGGVLAFVREWFATDPDVAKKAVVYGLPDIWRYAPGIEPVAETFFFGGDKNRDVASIEERRRFVDVLHAPSGWGSYFRNGSREGLGRLDFFRLALRCQLAFTSCVAGSDAHAKGDLERAFAFYEFVLRELDRDNIVAVFNELELASAGFKPAQRCRKLNEKFVEGVMSDKHRRYNIQGLAMQYGYVMNRQQMLRLGVGLADGGEREVGLAHIERAIEMMPSDAGEWVRLNVLVPRWITGDAKDREAAKAEFAKVLERDPENYAALKGMSRIAMMEGDMEGAVAGLERAIKAGGDDPRIAVDLARLRLMKGEFDKARPVLLKATDEHPSDPGAWLLRVGASLAEYDSLAKGGAEAEMKRKALLEELDGKIVPALERLGKGNPDCLFAKADVLMRHGDKDSLAKARTIMENIAGGSPKNPAYREKLMQVIAALGDIDGALPHAEKVLANGADSPLANFIVGSTALREGELEKSEAHLRRAAKVGMPIALNNLAECLRRRKEYTEAESFARKATESDPKMVAAWETLGAIILDCGDASRYEEAEGYLQKAWDMTKGDGEKTSYNVAVSLARAKALRGDKPSARMLLRIASRHVDRLGSDYRKLYDRLSSELK